MSTPDTVPKKSSRIRKWVTPLTMGTFLLTAGTGLGLFFEAEWGFVKPLHEWLSLTLVLGGALHVFDHWKGIRNHLSSPWGKAFVLAGAAFLVLAFLPLGGKDGDLSKRDLGETLSRVPLATLAQARQIPLDTLQARLLAAGFPNAQATSTLEQLAGKDGHKQFEALQATFGTGHEEEEEDEH